MSKTDTVSPLRQRMIEDMAARNLIRTPSAATSTDASGLLPGSNVRPIPQRPARCAVFSST
jgi:hypothetical protein